MLSLLYILLCMKDLVCLYWKLLLMGVQYYLIIKSCFPEIAGDAAVYFLLDEQGSDLVEKMKMAFSWSNEERESIIQSGV